MQETIKRLGEMPAALPCARDTLRHIVIRNTGNQYMLILVARTNNPGLYPALETLQSKFKDLSIYLNINDKDTNVITGDRYIHIAGPKVLTGEVCGIKYELSPDSFAQINDGVRDLIYKRAEEEISGVVIDAYSGIGIMTALAAKQCSRAYGIEIVDSAVKDAGRLAVLNGLEDKMTNICGDCAEELPKLLNKIRRPVTGNQPPFTTLILDPPRKGCDEKVLQAVLSSLPDKIIYISCNPATLARDLKFLSEKYTIKEVTPYDMFPQTRHTECFVILER